MVIIKLLTALFSLLPSKLANLFLKLLGHKISWNSKIGLSILYVKSLTLDENSVIGHFNFFKVDSVKLSSQAVIKNFNFFKGPIAIFLGRKSRIGKFNKFTRAYSPITYGKSSLCIEHGTRITYDNFFDLTCSISFGKNTQVAGKGSQFWTHGYMHANSGTERIRVDGEIIIGDNVYVGTKCVFNPGVKVSNAINIGGNSVISKDLNESGMYVNQSLRYLKKDAQEVRERLTRVSEKNLTEEIYTKNR